MRTPWSATRRACHPRAGPPSQERRYPRCSATMPRTTRPWSPPPTTEHSARPTATASSSACSASLTESPPQSPPPGKPPRAPEIDHAEHPLLPHSGVRAVVLPENGHLSCADANGRQRDRQMTILVERV